MSAGKGPHSDDGMMKRRRIRHEEEEEEEEEEEAGDMPSLSICCEAVV